MLARQTGLERRAGGTTCRLHSVSLVVEVDSRQAERMHTVWTVLCAKISLGYSLYKYMPFLASRIHSLPPLDPGCYNSSHMKPTCPCYRRNASLEDRHRNVRKRHS